MSVAVGTDCAKRGNQGGTNSNPQNRRVRRDGSGRIPLEPGAILELCRIRRNPVMAKSPRRRLRHGIRIRRTEVALPAGRLSGSHPITTADQLEQKPARVIGDSLLVDRPSEAAPAEWPRLK